MNAEASVYPKKCAKCERYCAMWEHHNRLHERIGELEAYKDALERKNQMYEVAFGLHSSVPYSEDTLIGAAEAIADCPYSGVYFLICDHRVTYIGQSKNVLSRIQQHKNDAGRDFSHFSVVWTPVALLDVVESLYIHIIDPSETKTAPLSWSRLLHMHTKEQDDEQ